MAWNGWGWRPYVPVAARRAQALREMERLRKKGLKVEGVNPRSRGIAETFWGQAWCRHLEKFSDYASRLPRGRTYVRNGSVCHLELAEGRVKAMVSGSELYDVDIRIGKLSRNKWSDLKKRCVKGIGSLLDLLRGRLSSGVMEVVTDRDRGLFPLPREIRLECSCPDWAGMCKHVAAVLYGVGVRLDEKPELLFRLRGVDPEELIGAGAAPVFGGRKGGRRIAERDLSEVFGIELAQSGKKRNGTGGASRESSVPVPERSGTTERDDAVTGKAVTAARGKFGMTRSQFARLLGVSAPTVALWEKRKGRLALRTHTRHAWAKAVRLEKQEAWRRLKRRSRA